MRMDVLDILGCNLTEAGILLDVTRSIGTFFVVLTGGGGESGLRKNLYKISVS